jgi:RNA polymerase primary sigma factor
MANLYSAEKRITNREGVIKQYLSDISMLDMFSSAEAEAECAFKAVKGDTKAKHELVTRNLRFVVSVAKSYVTEGVYLEDLINEGNIGLVEAAEKFNPTMGNKFFTYAVYWIVRNIRQYVSNNSRTVRLPINKVDAVRNVKKRMGTLEQELGRPVTVHDLIDSSATDSEINALKVMIELVEIGFTSFDSPIGGDEGNSTYHDILFDADELMPDNHLEGKDSLNIFKELLSRMKPIEQTIMFRRYGLDGGHPMTLKEISECSDISLTRERIRQIEKQVLKKLEDVTPKEMVC